MLYGFPIVKPRRTEWLFNVSPNWPFGSLPVQRSGEIQAGPLPSLIPQTRGAVHCGKINRIRHEHRPADLIGAGEASGPLPGEPVGERQAGGPLPGGLPESAPAGINVRSEHVGGERFVGVGDIEVTRWRGLSCSGIPGASFCRIFETPKVPSTRNAGENW